MIHRGDTKLKVWDISNGAIQSTPIAEHVIERGRGTDCCWSPDGEWIAFGETHATKYQQTRQSPQSGLQHPRLERAHDDRASCVQPGSSVRLSHIYSHGLLGRLPPARVVDTLSGRLLLLHLGRWRGPEQATQANASTGKARLCALAVQISPLRSSGQARCHHSLVLTERGDRPLCEGLGQRHRRAASSDIGTLGASDPRKFLSRR